MEESPSLELQSSLILPPSRATRSSPWSDQRQTRSRHNLLSFLPRSLRCLDLKQGSVEDAGAVLVEEGVEVEVVPL